MELEDERRALRKSLVDLDFRHKELHIAYKRENQDLIKHEQQQTELKIKHDIDQRRE